MNKRLTRIVKVIDDASSINICMKLLNLELNSYFSCLLNIIEESIIEYKDGEDYSYLIKVSDYIQKTYEKLSINIKQFHRKNIVTLRSILKKQMNSCIIMIHLPSDRYKRMAYAAQHNKKTYYITLYCKIR